MEYMSGWMAYQASQVMNDGHLMKEICALMQAGVRYRSQSMHSLYFAAGTFPDWSVV